MEPQPPKPIEEMTDEEKQKWEDLLEDLALSHIRTREDILEDLRVLLNNSQVQAMALIKKNSRYGVNCPYYLKAKAIYEKDNTAQHISFLLDQLNDKK